MRKLGNSDLRIAPVGCGAWAIGGSGWQFGLGFARQCRGEIVNKLIDFSEMDTR
jgi:hypothetical protein